VNITCDQQAFLESLVVQMNQFPDKAITNPFLDPLIVLDCEAKLFTLQLKDAMPQNIEVVEKLIFHQKKYNYLS
jgi:hypothetical protein